MRKRRNHNSVSHVDAAWHRLVDAEIYRDDATAEHHRLLAVGPLDEIRAAAAVVEAAKALVRQRQREYEAAITAAAA